MCATIETLGEDEGAVRIDVIATEEVVIVMTGIVEIGTTVMTETVETGTVAAGIETIEVAGVTTEIVAQATTGIVVEEGTEIAEADAMSAEVVTIVIDVVMTAIVAVKHYVYILLPSLFRNT